jgi:hypothetical protein
MRRLIIPAVAILLALNSPALAGFGKGTGEVGVGLAVTQLDSSTYDDTATGFGVRGGYNFTKLFELEGQLSRASASPDDDTLGDLDLDSTTLFVNGLFNFHPRPTIVPYALVGLGTTDVDVEGSGVSDSDSSTAYQFGGGSRFFFGKEKKMAARVEISWINEDTFDESSTHTNIIGGLTWKLGRN